MLGQQEVMGLWGGSVVREAYWVVQVSAGERAWMRYVESPLSGLVSRCQAHRRALVQVPTTTWSWTALHAMSSPHWQPLVSAGDWHSKYRLRSTRASAGLATRHRGSERVWGRERRGMHIPKRSYPPKREVLLVALGADASPSTMAQYGAHGEEQSWSQGQQP